MVARQPGGLATAKEIYQWRDRRAREIKEEGKKIIGYFCCYPPTPAMQCIAYTVSGSII